MAPQRLVAPVDSLTVAVLDTVPAQVEVELAGSLADSCSRIELVEETSQPEHNRVRLAVEAARPAGALCAQVITPYRLRIWIDVSAFPAGRHVVEANGIDAPFEIEPVGDFPVLSLALFESDSRVIVPDVGLALIGPGDWERTGLVWKSPPFWSARIGLRWHDAGSVTAPEELLPGGSTLHESSLSRLGWGVGVRFRISRDEETSWSEHLFVDCGQSNLCEFWMAAPSDPLLDAASEAFWRMVRFAARVTTTQSG